MRNTARATIESPRNSRRLPPTTLQGTLARTPVVQVLAYALRRNLQGTLELRTVDRRVGATLLFANGALVKARTTEPVAHLGGVLRDLGYLSEAQLRESLAALGDERNQQRPLHGELLLARGLIDRSHALFHMRPFASNWAARCTPRRSSSPAHGVRVLRRLRRPVRLGQRARSRAEPDHPPLGGADRQYALESRDRGHRRLVEYAFAAWHVGTDVTGFELERAGAGGRRVALRPPDERARTRRGDRHEPTAT